MANVWDTKASNYDTNYGSSQVFSDVFNKSTQGIGYDWSSAPSQNINWNQTLTPAQSNAPGFLDFAKDALDALNVASKWRGLSSASPSSPLRRGQTVSSPSSEVTDLGSGYKLINRAHTTKQKITGGSSGSGGIGGTIGQIAGLGAGLLLAPATGGASAALSAASLGSGIGGSVGRTVEGFFG